MKDQALSPYLALVAASRNDDHGGGLLRRMQIFVDSVLCQSARHRVPLELVLVEWNPPPNRAPLADALDWRSAEGWGTVRIVRVPSNVHSRFEHADRLPLFQMIAKNVGVRRTAAPFVLATNIDLIFNDEMFSFLSERRLTERTLYRADRWDVDAGVPLEGTMDDRLAFCRQNLLRVNARDGIFPMRNGRVARPWTVPRNVAEIARKIFPQRFRRAVMDAVPNRVIERFLFPPAPVGLPPIHTNACGDFTLLHVQDWEALRGYAEFGMYSFHIDSLLCVAAHHAGIKEQVLGDQMRVFHIEHGGGWTPEIQRTGVLDRRLQGLGVPKLSDDDLFSMAAEMARNGRPTIFNDDRWGLADVDLEQHVFRP